MEAYETTFVLQQRTLLVYDCNSCLVEALSISLSSRNCKDVLQTFYHDHVSFTVERCITRLSDISRFTVPQPELEACS